MSSSADTPNIAVIPLPAGFTLEELYVFQYNVVTIAITAAITFGIIVWDYFYLLPDEYKFYQTAHKSDWRTLAPYTFMILRCSGVVSLLASMCISSFQSQHCQVGLVVSQIAAIVVTATSGIAFGYRAMGVWRFQNRRATAVVSSIIVVMWSLMVGGWIAVASQLRVTSGTSMPFGSNCLFSPFIAWLPLSHGLSFLFNITILALMLMKLRENREHPSPLHRIAYTDSLILIAIATGASVTVLTLHGLGEAYQTTKQIAMPFSTLVSATMGARVFLILRITPPGVEGSTANRTPAPNYTFTHSVIQQQQRFEDDKPSDGYGLTHNTPPAAPHPAPAPAPTADYTYPFDSKSTPSSSPYSASSKTKFLPPSTTSPSSASSSPKTPYARNLAVSTPHASTSPSFAPSPTPASSAFHAPPISPNLRHNEYTTFPDPPSPPQPAGVMVIRKDSMDVEVDAETPLLQTKFGGLPGVFKDGNGNGKAGKGKGKGRRGKKNSEDGEDMKSGWV